MCKLADKFVFSKGKNAQKYTKTYLADNIGEYPVYSGQTENDGIMGKINSYDYDLQECLFTTTVGAKVMTPKYLTGKFSLSQNCCIMNPKLNDVSVKYFYYVMWPMFDNYKMNISNNMQPSLRIGDLNTFVIPLPSLKEQQAIAQYLDSKTSKIDNQIQYYESLITELKSFKQSIISEAVTGKLTA